MRCAIVPLDPAAEGKRPWFGNASRDSHFCVPSHRLDPIHVAGRFSPPNPISTQIDPEFRGKDGFFVDPPSDPDVVAVK